MHSNCFSLFSLALSLALFAFSFIYLPTIALYINQMALHRSTLSLYASLSLSLCVKHLQVWMSHEMFQLPATDNDKWPWATLTAHSNNMSAQFPSLSLLYASLSLSLSLFIASSMLAKLIFVYF